VARKFIRHGEIVSTRSHDSEDSEWVAGKGTDILGGAPMVVLINSGSASASILGKDALRLRTRNRYWVARRHRGVGRIGALLLEDLKKRPSIARIRGVWEGLLT
jgi:hypothetical protein